MKWYADPPVVSWQVQVSSGSPDQCRRQQWMNISQKEEKNRGFGKPPLLKL
jgi:hypothetical protein